MDLKQFEGYTPEPGKNMNSNKPDYSKCPTHGTEATYPHLSGRPVCEICETMTESQIWIAIHDCIAAARQEEREACAGIMDDAMHMLGEAGMYAAATLMRAYAKRIREGK